MKIHYIARFNKQRLPLLKAHWYHHRNICTYGTIGLDQDCIEEGTALAHSLGLKVISNESVSFNGLLKDLYKAAWDSDADWILSLDSDEFVYRPEESALALIHASKENAVWVGGWLCDRFAPRGIPVSFPSEVTYETLAETFCVSALYTEKVMKACTTKVVFVKRPHIGEIHSVGNQTRVKNLIRLDHFKWSEGIEKYLEERVERLKSANYVYQHKNALSDISSKGRFSLGSCLIDCSVNIPGWFDYKDIYDLAAKEAKENDKLVELGSWLGKSAAYMASRLQALGKNTSLYLVDRFRTAPDYYIRSKDAGAIQAKTGGSYLHKTIYNLQKYQLLERTSILQLDTSTAAKIFNDKSVFFVFVDADHSYEGCKKDLVAWYPKIKEGGIFAGHDYNWESVKKAVNEFASINKLKLKFSANKKSWFIRL